jgi:hypothetical protein
LVPGWRKHLEKAHEEGLTRPRYQYTWSWEDKEETIPGLQYGGDKIHTRMNYRWKHPVHEVIIPDRIEETRGWIDLQIEHHPDHSKSRSQYMPLLKLAVEEDPADDRNAFYYAQGVVFPQTDRDEAKQAFLRHLTLTSSRVATGASGESMRYIAKCSEGVEKEYWLKRAAEEAPGATRSSGRSGCNCITPQRRWQDCLDTCEKILT